MRERLYHPGGRMGSGKVLRDGAPVLRDGVGLRDFHSDLPQSVFLPALMLLVEMMRQGQRGMICLAAVQAGDSFINS